MEKKKLDYFTLLIAPLKFKKQIIIINVIVIIIATGIMAVSKFLPSDISFLPDVYTAEAKILMPSQDRPQMDSLSISELANSMLFNLSEGARTSQLVIGLLSSKQVIDGVLNDYLLARKPKLKKAYESGNLTKNDLRKEVLNKASFWEDDVTGFIVIQYSDINSIIAKDMVDNFLNMLTVTTQNLSLTQAVYKKRFIEERLIEINARLEKAKDKYIGFQRKYGIISPEHEAEQLSTTIASLRTELITKEAELANCKRIHIDDSETAEIEFKIKNLRNEIKNLTHGSSSKNKYQISKSKISELTSEFQILKRNVENLESIYGDFLKEFELAQLQEKTEGTIIQILEAPEIPEKKSGPSRSVLLFKIFILSLSITLILPILVAYIRELLITNPELTKKVKLILENLSFKK